MGELILKRHAGQTVSLPVKASESGMKSSLANDAGDEADIGAVIEARLDAPAGDADELLFLPGTSRGEIFKRLLRLRDEARAAQGK